jgi:hypothetical protein
LGFVVLLLIGLIASTNFHPWRLIGLGASSSAVVAPPVVGPTFSRKVEAPKVEASVVGRIGAVMLIRVGDRTQSLEAWRGSGATVIGQPGVCPWGMVVQAVPVTGRCS